MDIDLINFAKTGICIFVAMIPISVWGYIFYQKNPEDRKWTFITFLAGMVAVVPILLYKYSWQFFPQFNAFDYVKAIDTDFINIGDIIVLPWSVVLTFMLVGVFEEYLKHLVVHIVDRKRFRTIDDAIEYSIIAALGFAYIENILYFTLIWEIQGLKNFVVSVIFRSIFSTFAHILFSGIYGYYYGVAHFSNKIYQDKVRKNRFILIKLLHNFAHLKGRTLFHEEKILEGLLFAVFTHAFFNILLEQGWTYLIVPYLVFGFIVLSYLFDKKEDHKILGEVKNRR